MCLSHSTWSKYDPQVDTFLSGPPLGVGEGAFTRLYGILNVLAEDIRDCSSLIPSLVERYGIPYTYVVSPLPEMYKRLPKKESPRGVSSRRAALNKILEWHNQTTCADQQAGTKISPLTSILNFPFFSSFISGSCILW